MATHNNEAEHVFEIEIVDVSNMPEHTQTQVAEMVSKMTEPARYKGFAKIIHVTASPPRIKSVEPIEGTPADYFKKTMEGVDISVF